MMLNNTPRVLKKASYSDLPAPLLAVVGPLAGLAYIIVLPFVGIAGLVYLGGSRAAQGVATLWRRIMPVGTR